MPFLTKSFKKTDLTMTYTGTFTQPL